VRHTWASEAARVFAAHVAFGGGGAILANPLPDADAIPADELADAMHTAEAEAERLNFEESHLREFVHAEVGEVERHAEAPAQSLVRVEEALHVVGVARGDHDRISGGQVLHDLLESFAPKVFTGIRARGETVRLVDEEHTTGRLVDLLARLGPRLADVRRHEVRPLHLDEGGSADGTKFMEEARDEAGDGGLAAPGVTREDHVQRTHVHKRRANLEPKAPLHQSISQRSNLVFDGFEADDLGEARLEIEG
jgi:hypothetical protein